LIKLKSGFGSVGHATFKLHADEGRNVSVHINRRGLSRLHRIGRLRVRAIVHIAPGKSTTVSLLLRG
jgi:hypothetical protein